MKITNAQMRDFINGSTSILSKKIPRKLFSAVYQNRLALKDMADTFNTQIGEIDTTDVDAVKELLDIESEVVVQTVSESVFDAMDSSDKFDSLTGAEYLCLSFMIE